MVDNGRAHLRRYRPPPYHWHPARAIHRQRSHRRIREVRRGDWSMRAAVFVGPRTLEVRDVPDLEIGPGEVLVRNQVSGICGSDIHLYSDTIPEFTPRILGKVLGHELCGEVVAVAP